MLWFPLDIIIDKISIRNDNQVPSQWPKVSHECLCVLQLISRYRVGWLGGELDCVSKLINEPVGHIEFTFTNRQWAGVSVFEWMHLPSCSIALDLSFQVFPSPYLFLPDNLSCSLYIYIYIHYPATFWTILEKLLPNKQLKLLVMKSLTTQSNITGLVKLYWCFETA